MKRWRLAVIGCGAAAFGIHLPVLTRSERFDVISVSDCEGTRAKTAAQRFDVPNVYTDAEVAIGSADMVAVLTPQHEALIEAAIAAGSHVFTEKPVSLDLGRTRELRQQATDAGIRLEVGAMRLHDPAVQAVARRVCAEGDVAGSFTKLDGADRYERARLLPTEFTPYMFDGAIPGTPYERALRTLLWSGYHLLTVLVLVAPRLSVESASEDPVGTLHAELRTSQGARLTVTIGPAAPRTYLEEAALVVGAQHVRLEFSPPYGPGARSRLTIGDGATSQDTDSPFTLMWAELARRLDGVAEVPPSIDAAVDVEALAARIATAAATDPHGPREMKT